MRGHTSTFSGNIKPRTQSRLESANKFFVLVLTIVWIIYYALAEAKQWNHHQTFFFLRCVYVSTILKYRSLKKELENYGIDKIKKKYLTRTKEINEILPLIIDNIKSPLDGGVEKVEVKVEKVAEKEQLLITLYEVVEK